MRSDLQVKDEKLSSIQKELEEIGFSGETEAEIAQIKRTNIELLRKYKEQEEELDEMAGQIQVKNLIFIAILFCYSLKPQLRKKTVVS